MAYYIGLDLGQSADYTALAVVQTVPTYDAASGKHSSELHLRYLERYPLKTPYTHITDHVRDLLFGPPFTVPVLENGRVAKPSTQLSWTRPG